VKNLSVDFKEKKIISDYSYDFYSEKFYVIFGKSGVGKSTILRTFANLIKYDGEIFLDNENTQNILPQKLRTQIHYLHQEPILFEGDVKNNLKLPFNLKNNHNLKYSEEKVRELLSLTGLDTSILSEKIKNLSGGEKQRICLIRAILIEPKFLLLDEPSSALDMGSESQLIDILKNISNKIGVICVSHSAKIILNADIKLLMENTQLIQKDEELNYDKIYKMVENEQSYS
jgi:ABC-type bacteriocin/lantibiotic exporter with double-glycine peptidase domain